MKQWRLGRVSQKACYKVTYSSRSSIQGISSIITHRPLLLVPPCSVLRTSGSQSRQYHVRDWGASVKPTQSRWNCQRRDGEYGMRIYIRGSYPFEFALRIVTSYHLRKGRVRVSEVHCTVVSHRQMIYCYNSNISVRQGQLS